MAGSLEREAGTVTLDDLKKKMADFATERNWDQFHSPRNLLLALVGEVGELSEIFQWKGEVERGLDDWEEKEKLHLGEELSDVLLYLVRLSDICGVDLGKAALRKIELNAIKYPLHICKGSSSSKKCDNKTKLQPDSITDTNNVKKQKLMIKEDYNDNDNGGGSSPSQSQSLVSSGGQQQAVVNNIGASV